MALLIRAAMLAVGTQAVGTGKQALRRLHANVDTAGEGQGEAAYRQPPHQANPAPVPAPIATAPAAMATPCQIWAVGPWLTTLCESVWYCV